MVSGNPRRLRTIIYIGTVETSHSGWQATLMYVINVESPWPEQASRTHLSSYCRNLERTRYTNLSRYCGNLKNECVFYIFALVHVISVWTRIMCVCVCTYVYHTAVLVPTNLYVATAEISIGVSSYVSSSDWILYIGFSCHMVALQRGRGCDSCSGWTLHHYSIV
jgi:hypothetical protein